MKSLKKSGLLVLAVSSLALAACNKTEDVQYERGDDEAIYDAALGEYETLAEIARGIKDDNQRYIAYAAAEAALLDSGVMIPTTTQNGAYALTRVAPRTVPYVQYGIDEDKLANIVAVKGGDKNFIKASERKEMLELWEEARKGGAAYDPAAYLTGKGYEIADTYKTTFSSAPQTLDILSTSRAADTEYLTNGIEGLVGYNNLGFLEGKVAKSFGFETKKDADGNEFDVWTFELQDNPGTWVDNEGNKIADVTADDFVAGFQHMLDAQGGLDYLVDGIVVGVHEYLNDGGKFADVGVKADGNKVIFTLTKSESFFATRLVYSCFMPLCRSFYVSKGGAFGLDELAAAKAAGTYQFGVANDPASIVYNGAFRCTKLDVESEIKFARNTSYRLNDKTTINEISWIYDAGEDPDQTYADVLAGVYPGMNLSASTGTIDYAKRDGLFDDYSYVTETNATTFFGGMNMNRGTFELASGGVKSEQTESQKIAIHNAMNNRNFRRAIQHGWDRASYNAVSRGKDLATTNLRNMYTAPEFVSLSSNLDSLDISKLASNYYAKKEDKSTDWSKPLIELEINGKAINMTVGYENILSSIPHTKGTTYGELVQAFLNLRYGEIPGSPYQYGECPIDVRDGNYEISEGVTVGDGWYNPKLAREFFWDYILECGSEFPAEGLVIDNVYYGGSTAQTAQANAFKQSLEDTFTIAGRKYVTVNLISASTVNDYYYSGYYCEAGEEVNQDIFYGSGWGPDYADPSTYLDTFKRTDGYMLMVLGINNHQKSAD